MKKAKYAGTSFVSNDGKLTLPREIIVGLGELAGKRVTVTIEDETGKRSPNQNAYYWAAIVTPITDAFNDLGERFTTDIVHEILKYKFLRVFVPDTVTGEVKFDYVRSTSDLKVFEFAFCIEDCIRYAAETLSLAIEQPTDKRQEYIFPIFQEQAQERAKYLEKIEGYLQDIFDKEYVKRFFRQNPDWKDDTKIKSLFRKRFDEL
jgi:hypothetical protein